MNPLSLAAMGSYMVGGRAVTVANRPSRTIGLSAGLGIEHDPNGTFWIEQAYVQYFVPEVRRIDYPLVLIHGGGLTGSAWETTPDGRPGWLHDFLSAGVVVHVVDNVERGRSGFCALDGEWDGVPIVRSEQESWSLYRIGDAVDFERRLPYAGQRFPWMQLNELTRRTVPRWSTTIDAQRRALLNLIEGLGSCMVLGHSQGGGFAIELAAARPDLVHAAVALEPHGDFSSIGSVDLDGRPLLLVTGDYVEKSSLWQDLTIKAQSALLAWQRAGGKPHTLDLNKQGMPGHSHMMMMDEGSDQIAKMVVDWLSDVMAR